MAVQLTIEDAGPTYRVTVENLTPDVVTLGIEPIQAQQDVVLEISAGRDGASAYQLWLAAGNTGTVEDFLASLQGGDGDPATVAIGTVTTGEPGSAAAVTNVGTSSAAVLNFTIPRGADGVGGGGGSEVVAVVSSPISNGSTTDFVEVSALDVVVPAGSAADLGYQINFIGTKDAVVLAQVYAKTGTALKIVTIQTTQVSLVQQFGDGIFDHILLGKGSSATAFSLLRVLAWADTETTLGFRFYTTVPGDAASLSSAFLSGKILTNPLT